MSTMEIAKKYVELCRAHQHEECLATLFAADAVSVEAVAQPGMERIATGVAALRAKSAGWIASNEMHSAELQGPWPHDDRFAVRFLYDVTNKHTGARMKLDEVGLFTVKDGKIVREEFFYAMGG